MYQAHPSPELNDLFAHKPYQGVAPDQATFLFVGLDANYDEQIAARPIFFEKILDYHVNGVAFWREHDVHHPFLLPEYSGDGRLYHRSFGRIGFTSEHAELVSFMELLHVPTVGRNALVAADLKESHLKMLNAAILDGQATHIFLPAAVARLMRASRTFRWLPRAPDKQLGPLGVWYTERDKTIYSHLHFSVYGKFAEQKASQAVAIRDLIAKSANNSFKPKPLRGSA